MSRTALVAAAVVALALPSLLLGAVGLLMANAQASACADSASLVARTMPDGLVGRTADGTPVRLGSKQLAHAAAIIDVGGRTTGAGRDGVLAALTAALTESTLRMLTNTRAYPSSASFPNDGDGADHDSLGLFQMRPAAGWGSVAELMDPAYQAQAFFGGPGGPNHGSPRGLLDIAGWKVLGPAAAAQAVEVSAFPDRYARWVPVAEQILTTLTAKPASGFRPAQPSVVEPVETTSPAEADTVDFPLPAGVATRTSGYGMRRNPVLGVWRLHAGDDLAAPAGTPVLATASGRVVVAEMSGGLGNHIAILHTVSGATVASVYGHLLTDSQRVAVGDDVVAGQVIGLVGSTGNSTGPHLHFEIRPGGADRPAIDPTGWLDAASVVAAPSAIAAAASPGCPTEGAPS